MNGVVDIVLIIDIHMYIWELNCVCVFGVENVVKMLM